MRFIRSLVMQKSSQRSVPQVVWYPPQETKVIRVKVGSNYAY